MIHKPNVPVYQVYGRIGPDDKGIGEMKLTNYTRTKVVMTSKVHLYPLSEMKAPVLLGSIWGQCFPCESKYSPLRFEIRNDSSPVSPQQSKGCGILSRIG